MPLRRLFLLVNPQGLFVSRGKKHDRLPDFIVVEGSQAGGHLGFPMEELSENREQTLEEIFKMYRPWSKHLR
ncbi:MAG: hypothetical protein ACLR13_07075 [Acutalibacteraceae bacterium]